MAKSKAKKRILKFQKAGKRWIRWSLNGKVGAVFDPDNDPIKSRRLGDLLKANLPVFISASPRTLYWEVDGVNHFVGDKLIQSKNLWIDFIPSELHLREFEQ